MGIPSIAYTGGVRDDLVSLYPLGAAYAVEPNRVERFLDANWPKVREIGFWDSYDLREGRVIRVATAAHTLSSILGALRSGPSHVEVYLKAHGLYEDFLGLFEPGRVNVDLSASPVEAKGGPFHESPVRLSRPAKGKASVPMTLSR